MSAGRLCKSEEILPWDWRHRIGFDASLKKRIQRITGSIYISSKEKLIIDELIEYFVDYISVDCLLNTLLEGHCDPLADLKFLDKTKILSVPSICQGIIINKYQQLEGILHDQSHPVKDLIEVAFNTQYVARPMDSMKIVFGDMLPNLIGYGKAESIKAPQSVIRRKSILPDDASSIVEEYSKLLMSGLPRDLLEQEKAYDPCFVTRSIKGPGFAEYWPWYLTQKEILNTLILYENEDSLREDQFYSTLNHELYPGHAYFYQYLEKARPRFVDHGAYALVEGWATWAEWNGFMPEFATHSRAFRLRSLTLLDFESVCNVTDIYAFMSNEGYSDANVIEACMHFYQYPSLGVSYTLGAIWFEKYLSGRGLNDFFEELSRCDLGWGDFFRIW